MKRRENPLKRHDTTHSAPTLERQHELETREIFTLKWLNHLQESSLLRVSFTWRATRLSPSRTSESIRLWHDGREDIGNGMFWARRIQSREQFANFWHWSREVFIFDFAEMCSCQLTYLTIIVLENLDIVMRPIYTLRSCSFTTFQLEFQLLAGLLCVVDDVFDSHSVFIRKLNLFLSPIFPSAKNITSMILQKGFIQ